jgi:glycosyltransferase involved in cell wall biosynthesis
MLFSLITGPGNHANYLIKALQKDFEFDFAEYWPKYKYSTSNAEEATHSLLFDFSSFGLYAAQNRLRFATQSKWHLDILLTLYDRINSKKITGRNLIAWPQVSLNSMQKTKRNQGKIILEQPMCHVDFWNSVSKSEHNKLNIPDNVSFSKYMTGRMKQEYQQADHIVVHSHFAKKTFTDNGFLEHQVTVCPLGVDMPQEEIILKRTQKKLQILYVGRVEILKGVHYLLKASEALEAVVDVHIAGSIQPDFLNIAKKYEGKVKFHGQLSKEHLADLYRQTDLLIFPSLYDAFGMTIIEAMSYGLPVIASANSAGPDIISDHENGFVVPPFSSDHLIEKIEWIIKNKELYQGMSISARRRVEDNYSFEKYATKVKAIVSEIFLP